jgi:CopG family transcriptional regulator, nickel-responsive regulator
MSDSLPTALARLSMSLPAKLMDDLDAMIIERELPSRSSVIAELIRGALAEYAQESGPDAVIAGTITLIYRAGFGTIRHRIAQKQRDYLKEVISSQHVFLEDDQSLEVLLVQGPPARLRALCDDLRKVRGVQQVRLVKTTALLPPLHDHVETMADNPAARDRI